MKKITRRLLAFVLAFVMMFPSTVMASSITLGTKPEDGTTYDQPFPSGTGGSDNFRIPGIVTLDDGTLVATADARWDYEKDGGGMDLIVSRSTDNGKTWEYTFPGYLGDNGNVWNADSTTLMDPVIMTDGTTLYLLADMYPAGYSISSSSTTNTFEDTGIGFDGQGRLLLSADSRSSYGYYLNDGAIYSTDGTQVSGYTVDGWFNLYQDGAYVTNLFFADSPYQVRATSYICMMTSTDGGANWSDPTLLNLKSQGTTWMVLGPGRGLVTDNAMMFSAYDGSNVYLIFSKDGGTTWNKVSTSAAGNESQLVELNDGTVRMFVKQAGTNKIGYIDFTRSGDSYTAGSLINTSVANFSQCMISAFKYPELIDGKQAILVCSPSKSDGGTWAGRFNGKIHVFLLDDENNMTDAYSYQVNNSFFAYSNMTMLEDGSIGLLYEDDCISYAAGSYYGDCSHITYTNLSMSTIAPNAVIGVEESTEDTAEGIYESAAEDAARVTEVSFMAGERETKTYVFKGLEEGQSLGTTSYDENVISVAVSGTEIMITPVAAGSTTITFTVQDTAARTIAAGTTYELTVNVYDVAKVKDITLYVGETVSLIDETGDYKESYTGEGLDTTVSAVTVEQTTEGQEKPLSEIVSGRTYRIESYEKAVKNYEDRMLTNGASSGKLVLSGDSSTRTDNVLWTFVENTDGSYSISDTAGKYLNIGNSTASVSDSQQALSVNKIFRVTSNSNSPSLADTYAGWLIGTSDHCYLNPLGGATVTTAGGWQRSSLSEADDNDGNYWKIYAGYNYTEITFEGVSEGETSVVVGDTQYNINVLPIKEVTVELNVGESKTLTDTSGTYTEGTIQDSSVAEMNVQGTADVVAYQVSGTAATSLQDGNSYLICITGSENALTSTEVSRSWSGVHLVAADNDKAASESNVWTLEAADTTGSKYRLKSAAGYLALGPTTNQAAVGDAGEDFTFAWVSDSSAWTIGTDTPMYLNNLGGYGTDIGGWTGNGTKFDLYQVTETITSSAHTEVTFTGTTVGNTIARVGNVQYNIVVKDIIQDTTEGDLETFTAIVGTQTYTGDNTGGDVALSGKEITALTTSVGTSFQLGVDISDADKIIWSSADTSIATVDSTGLVTGVGAGETTVTATVIKDGIRESISIPVHVLPSFGEGATTTTVCYYVEEITDTDAYYTLYSANVSEELVQVIEGQVIYFERPVDIAFSIVWLSAPYEGYALTYMAATGSDGQYYPLHTGDNVLNTSSADYYAGGMEGGFPYYNLYTYYGAVKDTVDAMLERAIDPDGDYQCDGAMSMGRKANDGVPALGSKMSFRSQKLPTVSKKVNGVLGNSGLRADWRVYEAGMSAKADEYIFFEITVDKAEEQDRIDYTNVILTDLMEGAFFTDGTFVYDYDSSTLTINKLAAAVLDESTGLYSIDLTDIFATANTDAISQTYYVVYQIKNDDLDTVIENHVKLEYSYQSEYSKGSMSNGADADASITATQFIAQNLVADFALPVKATYGTWGAEAIMLQTGEKAGKASYGDVNVQPVTNAADAVIGWEITYVPTTVMQGVDVVSIYSVADEQGNQTEYNFKVYPATSVYYDENFATYTDGWNVTDKSSVLQETAVSGQAALGANNYGYDGAYDGVSSDDNAEVTATVAQSKTIGDVATFGFTGTGVDIYADCTSNTGITIVRVRDAETGALEKMYIVDTKLSVTTVNEEGEEENTTDGNLGLAKVGTAKNVPIVSITTGTLEHKKHTITMNHVKKSSDETTRADGIILDGFRVYGTATLDDAGTVYMADGELNPVYMNMRDQLLASLNAGTVTDESVYADQIANNIHSQVYASYGTTAGMIIVSDSNLGYTEENLKDFLDNSSKNELYLYPGQSLVFKIDTASNLQLGMRALNGAVTYSVNGETDTSTLASNVDMFYRITTVEVTETEGDETNTYYRFTITNNSQTAEGGAPAVLAITKLKNMSGISPCFVELNSVDLTAAAAGLGYEVEPEYTVVNRIFGANRYATSFVTAEKLKEQLGVDKFNTVLVTTGQKFADALSGSYLAAVKNAPILLSDDACAEDVADYIKENLTENGTVYILGGDKAVSENVENAIRDAAAEQTVIKRLKGNTRYETNLEILKEAAEADSEAKEILVCKGTDYADSLAASALAKPILMVDDVQNTLLEEQKEYLAGFTDAKIYIIGGSNAVSPDLEAEISEYADDIRRVKGATRYETSVEVAKEFFGENAEAAFVAYAYDFPDGLCGGPLAAKMNAPMILTTSEDPSAAISYMQSMGIESGYVLGGNARIKDLTAKEMFDCEDITEMIWNK